MHNREKEIGHFNLPDPSWKGVRSLYKKLSSEFNILTSAYDIELNSIQKLHLDHLIIVIDEVDKAIDTLPQKPQRDDLTKSLIEYLKNDDQDFNHPLASSDLQYKMRNIKWIVHHLNIVQDFVSAAESIFLHTELKRHTRDKDQMLNWIMIEGEATARLPYQS